MADQDQHSSDPHNSDQHNSDLHNSAMSDPRTYFAAERTFLAWIRTGLALMGVGFAVARFGLFLHELHPGAGHARAHTTGLSLYSGVALVALGVAVQVFAIVHHLRTTSALQANRWRPAASRGAVALGLLLAAVGVGMAIFLLVLR